MFYIGPYEWFSNEDGDFWGAPLGASSIVDLRSLPMMAQQGGTPQGSAVFHSFVPLPDPYILLGDDPTELLTGRQRSEWRRLLGLTKLDAQQLGDVIWETLTLRADPQGQVNAKPIIPTMARQLELHINGSVRRVRFDPNMPEFNGILAVLQNDYRRIRETVLNSGNLPLNERMPDDHHRKILGSWKRKYRIDDEGVFIPSDLPRETALEPTTTINESFNTADSNTLGPDLSWTEITTDIDIVSNTAQCPTQNKNRKLMARADTDLSSDDHYVQVSVPTANISSILWRGPVARKDGTNTKTWYEARCKRFQPRDLAKEEAGSTTIIGTATTSPGLADNDVLKVQCDGSTIKRFLNGGEEDSVTDTAITGNLRCGIRMRADTSGVMPNVDLFEAADLAGDVNIAVPLDTITFTNNVPIVGAGKSVAVPLAVETMAEFVPKVGTSAAVPVPLDTLSIANLLPKVGTSVLVTVPLATITLADLVPAVAAGKSVIVPLDAITIADFVPLIAAGGVIVAVPLNALTIANLVPAVASGGSVAVPLDTLVFANFAPAIAAGGIVIDVPLDAITITDLVPAVASGKNVIIGLAIISITDLVLAVASGKSIIVPLDAITIADQVPIIGTSALVDVPLDVINISDFIPIVGSGKSIDVPLDALTIANFAPAITAGPAALVGAVYYPTYRPRRRG